MKPLQIVLLVAAGAVGGALIMKVAVKPARPPALAPAPAPVVAQAPAPVPAPITVPEPAAPKAQARPSPLAGKKLRPGNPEPVAIAEDEPAPAVAPPIAAPAVEPPKEAPAPSAQPVPPVPAEPENATPLPPGPEGTPPEPHKVTLNAGMLIPVRLVDGLSSERNAPGDAFLATLEKELVVGGFVIAERGARVEGRVVASDRGGKVKGVAGIAVELTRLHTSDGQNVAIRTDSFERHAEQTHGEDAQKVAVGAAIGAAVGAMGGGGKGAAIGAGVGAGAGAGDVLLTRGKPAALPSETRITFRLRAPLTLTERL